MQNMFHHLKFKKKFKYITWKSKGLGDLRTPIGDTSCDSSLLYDFYDWLMARYQLRIIIIILIITGKREGRRLRRNQKGVRNLGLLGWGKLHYSSHSQSLFVALMSIGDGCRDVFRTSGLRHLEIALSLFMLKYVICQHQVYCNVPCILFIIQSVFSGFHSVYHWAEAMDWDSQKN